LHYGKVLFFKKYIGLDKKIDGNERFIMTDGNIQIDDELLIFSDVDGQFESSSSILLKKTINGYIRDDFAHEQNLIVTSSDKTVLFSGCSHRGIANIMRTAKKYQPVIHAVFGGFHLYNPVTKKAEPVLVTQQLAKELSTYETVYYTGHCTGNEAFEIMHDIMGDKLQRLYTGMEFSEVPKYGD